MLENAAHPRRERREIRLAFSGRCAEGEAAQAEQHRLLCRRKRPGVPGAVPNVRPEIDAGEDNVDVLPHERAERDAVGGRAIHPVRVELLEDWRAAVRERPRVGDRVTHRRLLDVGGDDAHVAIVRGNFGERGDAWTVNAVVVGDQDSHASPLTG
jgi:hypothetical protein